ncbi:hypothetical protein V8B97DRAFT_2022180 [Scleroderma yunnanense]
MSLQPCIWHSTHLQAILAQPMASLSEQPHQGESKRPTGSAGSGHGLSITSTCGRIKEKNLGASNQQALKNINQDTPHTDILNIGSLPPLPDKGPVGHNKKEAQVIIAEVIFKNDPLYKDVYTVGPTKFQVSIGNCIATLWSFRLKGPYCKCCACFKQLGEGIMPDHAKYANLHSTIEAYDDLHSIWQGNPSFDSDPINSELDKNHAKDFLGIIQNKSSITQKTSDLGVGTLATLEDEGNGAKDMCDDQDLKDHEVEDIISHGSDSVMNDGGDFGDTAFDQEGMDFGDEELGVNMDSVSTQGNQRKTSWATLSKTTLTKASSYSVSCNKSQLQGQVSDLSQEAELMLASLSSSKTAQYIAKMKFMLKDQEIELKKEQLKMQWKDMEAKHFQEEAKTLQLKIQLTELMKANSGSGSSSSGPPA